MNYLILVCCGTPKAILNACRMAASILLMAALSNGSDLDLDSAWRPYSAMGHRQTLTYLSNDCVLVPHFLTASDFKMLVFLSILAAILASCSAKFSFSSYMTQRYLYNDTLSISVPCNVKCGSSLNRPAVYLTYLVYTDILSPSTPHLWSNVFKACWINVFLLIWLLMITMSSA